MPSPGTIALVRWKVARASTALGSLARTRSGTSRLLSALRLAERHVADSGYKPHRLLRAGGGAQVCARAALLCGRAGTYGTHSEQLVVPRDGVCLVIWSDSGGNPVTDALEPIMQLLWPLREILKPRFEENGGSILLSSIAISSP
jgi:hypothetical protein